MQLKLHKLLAKSNAGLRFAAAALLLFVNSFFTRAQDSDVCVRLHFAFDSAVLSETYMSNTSAMVSLDSLVAGIADGASVNVTTYSSPEGNFAYNLDLSRKRAEAVRNYIVSKYPALAGRITVDAGAEAWEELRNSLNSDSRLSSYARAQALAIIDSDADADQKEAQLKQISAYKSLYANYFKGLRYSEISLRIKNLAPATPQHTNAEFSEAKIQVSQAKENGEAIVYYSLSEDYIRPSHMHNGANLKEIRRILSNPENRKQTIVIEGSASPEGPVSVNTRLGVARAENLANWIIGQFPDMEDKVIVRSKGEDWEGLANAISGCSTISDDAKQELLDIINSSENADKKEELLKAHAAYATVQTDCLPYIRFARIAGLEPAPAQEPAVEPAQEPVQEPAPAVQETETEEVPVVEETPETEATNTVEEATQTIKRVPVAALTTNLLYEVGGAAATGFHTVPLTVGYEVPIGKHWSIYSDYLVTTPWHAWNNNADCAELMHWDLGARWYPGSSFKKPFAFNSGTRVLEGWYASLGAGCGYYDFERNGKGYQGEEILGSLGIGYSKALTDHWSLNFGIGVGPMYTRYRYYEGRSNNTHLVYQYSGNMQYIGVTDAKVTLTYLFYINKKQK